MLVCFKPMRQQVKQPQNHITPYKVGRFRDATDTVSSLEVFTTPKHSIGRIIPQSMTNMQIVKQLQDFLPMLKYEGKCKDAC